ncbi:UDP-N-acetyl-alpha-D-glucosamine C6 dehydratase [Phycisphaerae bacterium RAS1]|nr:UDP-N-acetyl-alpha-D-glucosamine C6 dehydratase [Phycisphaerae bacterium RAS1]
MNPEPEAPDSDGWRPWARSNRLALSVLAHLAMFAAAWLLAFGLAYNFKVRDTDWLRKFCIPLLLPVVAIKLLVFVLMRQHQGWWRYVSLRDVFSVARAAWLASVLLMLLIYTVVLNPHLVGLPAPLLGEPSERFPDSVFVLDFAGTIALVCGARLAVRLYYEEVRPVADGIAPNLLILGAGNSGENAVREILRMPVLKYRVVGFLDDDPAKLGAQIHGIEVLGPISMIKQVCTESAVDEILIAMPSASKAQVRTVIDQCKGANLRFKTLPAMADLIEGRATVSEIRDVDINDLLGRAPVKLDEHEIAKFIADRTVMVTGAGGSIGSEMCRQIARFRPRRLMLVEQSEHHLFDIDRELRASFTDTNFVPYIADIADRGRIERIFELERPTAVFHAAAHKHVPMMEYNPGEAVKNNINGTRIVADTATRFGCEKFVMISTDKAVNPTSIMGASKRVAELYIQGLSARSSTQFVTVRFGNVLGSSGSVIPIFKEQIANGGPVTVTHPEMVRYFMTIPEAAQLVLQSASMGHGGEIFVLDMGEPVKILDLARDLITLSGFRPDEDIKIEFCGIRPGEKLFEELAIEGEDVARTPHPKIGIWNNVPAEWDVLVPAIDALFADADALTRDDLRQRMKGIVPEFYLEAPPSRPASAHADSPASLKSSSTGAPRDAQPNTGPAPQPSL